MRAVFGSVVCAAALIVAGAAPSHAAQQTAATTTTRTASQSGASLDARVSHRLNADPTLKRYDIKVTTDGSVVTLSGSVPTQAARARAARLAKVNGVTRVDNQITVDTHETTRGTTGTVDKGAAKTKQGIAKGATATEHGIDKGAAATSKGIQKGAEKTSEGIDQGKSGAEKVYDKSKDGVETAYDKSKSAVETGVAKGANGAAKGMEKAAEGLGKVGGVFTDGSLEGKVKSKLSDEKTLDGSDIHVDSDNHVVTLSGTVPSAAARARAVAVATSVDGVSRVVDKLVVGSSRR